MPKNTLVVNHKHYNTIRLKDRNYAYFVLCHSPVYDKPVSVDWDDSSCFTKGVKEISLRSFRFCLLPVSLLESETVLTVSGHRFCCSK